MLVCMQKINFITHFFLKIFQRNSKLVILGNLDMSGHTPKMIVSIWGNIWYLSAGKKATPSFTFSLSHFFYCKDIVNLFWVLWTSLAMNTESDTINLLKPFVFICWCKKSTSSFMLFWRLIDSILSYKSRTRIFPNMGLVVKYQQQY